jgi:hypothetical protein
MRKVLLAMLCLAGPALAQSAGIPLAPFVAEYDVRYGSMPVGSSRTEVGHGTVPEHWFIETRSNASGFARLIASGTLVQRSDFALDGATIRPLRYRFDDGSGRSSKDVALDFDWIAGRVRGRAEGDPVDLAVDSGLQDAASIQALVQARLAAGSEPGEIAMIESGPRLAKLIPCSIAVRASDATVRRCCGSPRSSAGSRCRRNSGATASAPSRPGSAAIRRASEARGPLQARGSVTPRWPWYLPARSRYEVPQTSSDSKNSICATPSLA